MATSKRMKFYLGRLSLRLTAMQGILQPFLDRGYYNAERLRDLLSEAHASLPQPQGEEATFTQDGYSAVAKSLDQFTYLLEESRYPRVVFQEPQPGKRRQSSVLLLREELKGIRQILSGLMVEVRLEDASVIQPRQGPGPHFGLEQGRIGFSLPSTADVDRHNEKRLASLLPALRELVSEGLSAFGRNSPHGHIYKCLVNYDRAISLAWDQIDYELVAAFGVILANAEYASQRSVADRLTPSLEDNQAATLKSILDLHGPMILSTDPGRRLIEDAASYKQTQEEDAEFRSSATQLAEAIMDAGIATEGVGALLRDATQNIGLGPHPQRSSVVGGNVVRNATIVMIAGALVAYPAALGSVGLFTGWVTTVLFAEGVKRSKFGQDVSEVVRSAIDDPMQRQNFVKLAAFTRKHDVHLRRLASSRREFRWIHEWLDWLQGQPPSD